MIGQVSRAVKLTYSQLYLSHDNAIDIMARETRKCSTANREIARQTEYLWTVNARMAERTTWKH